MIAFGVITHLAERGHRVHVAVDRSDIAGALPANVVLHHIGRHGAETPRPVFMYRMRRLFGRLHSTERFDLIHQLNPVFAGLSLALIGTRVPIVLGTYFPEWPQAPSTSRVVAIGRSVQRVLKWWLSALQQRHAAALLLSTPAAKAKIVGLERHSGKMFMMPNGIDENVFTPAQQANDASSIVSLCGLNHEKGAGVLLDAFKLVHQAIPDAQLRIAGGVADGDIALARKRLADAAGSVHFLGAVSREAIPGLLRGSSVFCMPSLREPYGMAALEAMSTGLPVVASNGGGLAYLVPDEGGRKVAVGSHEELAAALIALLRDAALRRRCGSYNRALVLQQYAWPTVIERLESIYRTVLTRAATA